ncbi:hypothetical protein DOY81_004372 [Sarcophaga bullata]|nr:hypothetical protein DOY81_004372 [Sarcophaga bullata]
MASAVATSLTLNNNKKKTYATTKCLAPVDLVANALPKIKAAAAVAVPPVANALAKIKKVAAVAVHPANVERANRNRPASYGEF